MAMRWACVGDLLVLRGGEAGGADDGGAHWRGDERV